jgi:hypothetical protein
MTEAEWLACDDPYDLAKFCSGRVDPQHFRWLALDWGSRIRHIFNEDDCRYFDAFVAWVAGAGEHPDRLYPGSHFVPLCHWVSHDQYAIDCIELLRRDDPMTASAYAAASLAEYRLRRVDEPIDATKTHRPRSAKKLATLKAERDARHQQERIAREEHRDRVRREFCEQFRCISGNPFHPVVFDPAWRSETVVMLATGICADLAFDRLPILADALQETRCDNANILKHCRGDGPHVRGCWVIDLVLGKV